MNTRKILYLTMLIAMLLGTTACQQEDDPTLGKVKVTFIAELPDLPERIDSRAIGDGDYANELFLWVYDDEGREIPGLRQRNIGFQGKIARVTVYLTPGHTYGFAFWAQHKDILSYVPGNSLINMYYNVNCNDETRDAFWNWIPNLEVTEAGEITQDIILVRRLSQVNCGITLDAYLEAKRAGVDLKNYDSELILESTSEQPIAYKKTANGMGQASIQYFRLTEISEEEARGKKAQPASEYVLKSDFDALAKKVESLLPKEAK